MSLLAPEKIHQIIEEVATENATPDFVKFLDFVHNATYKTDATGAKEAFALNEKAYPLTTRILQEFEAPATLRGAVQDIKDALTNAEKVRIELAYSPSAEFVKNFYKMFVSLGFSDFLIEVVITAEAGSGAKVYYQGKFLDVSMLNLIKDKLKTGGIEF